MTVEEKAKLFAPEEVAIATEAEAESQAQEAAEAESLLLSIHLPSSQAEVRQVQVAKTTIIQDIRQHIYDSQFDQFLTCFHISSARNGEGKKRVGMYIHRDCSYGRLAKGSLFHISLSLIALFSASNSQILNLFCSFE